MEPREEDKKLTESIVFLNENKDTLLVKTLLVLLQSMVERARRENDDADADYLVRNQAKISAWKQVMEYITKGIPAQMIGGKP